MASPFAKFAAEICFGSGAGRRIDQGTCPDCGIPKAITTLTSEIAFREYQISGLCQGCQDKVFTEQ